MTRCSPWLILALLAAAQPSCLLDTSGLTRPAGPPSDAADNSDTSDAPDTSDSSDASGADAADEPSPDADDADAAVAPEAGEDAPQDAPIDEPTSLDGGEDAADDAQGDGGTLGWCATYGATAKFCDDFEGALAWDSNITSPSATLALITAFSSSPPRSLEFHASSVTQDGEGEAYRTKAVGDTAASVTFSFELWVAEVSTVSAQSIAAQLLLADGAGTEVRLSLLVSLPYAMSLEIEKHHSGQATTYSDYPLVVSAAMGKWVKVEYEVSAAPRELSIRMDGVPAIQGLSLSMLSGSTVTPKVRIGGCYVEAPSGPWTFRYDNVLVPWSADRFDSRRSRQSLGGASPACTTARTRPPARRRLAHRLP